VNFKASILSITITLIPLAPAFAADCNFNKPVGSCSANIQVLSSGGSKPSFKAEINITTSAASCSKVEYLLDNTPQTALLRQSNSDQESVFGTKPIDGKSFQIVKCTAYEDKDTARAATGRGPTPEVLAGIAQCASAFCSTWDQYAAANKLAEKYANVMSSQQCMTSMNVYRDLPTLRTIMSKPTQAPEPLASATKRYNQCRYDLIAN